MRDILGGIQIDDLARGVASQDLLWDDGETIFAVRHLVWADFGKGMRTAIFQFSESDGSLNGPDLFTELPFCRNPYQTLHYSLNHLPAFHWKPLFFTEKCFVASLNNIQTRCIVKGEAQKNPLFWRFSWGFWFFLRIACSLGIPQENLLKFNQISDFTNTPCKSTCLYNAPSMHNVDPPSPKLAQI